MMPARRGFTLVELLVVLTVIGVVIALVIAATSSAQATAQSALCKSQLREIGGLINARLDQRDRRMPVLFNRESTSEDKPAIDTALNAPRVDEAIFACPADDRQLYQATGTSYFWNFTINGQPVGSLFSVAGGDTASEIPLLADKEAFHPEAPEGVNVLYADGHASGELSFVSDLSGERPPEVPR